MARKKVTLQYIPNDSTRRGTFKKRRRGLMKKASELSILCDVKACVVVSKNMPELDQCKKMMNQEGFLRSGIDKLREQVHKSGRDCRDARSGTSCTRPWWETSRPRGALDRGAHQRGLEGGGAPQEHRRPHHEDPRPPVPLPAFPPGAAASPDAYLAGGADMGAPAMYQAHAPPVQERWLDMVSSGSGGDLSTVVYSGLNGSHDGAGTSASAGDDVMQPFDLGAGFAWQWAASPVPSPMSSFLTPMSAGRG
ncbi:hypothetical protein ACQ4PT_068149 [Festuca glaucescens]